MIAIINYGSGNIQSVKNALNRLGTEAVFTDNADIIRNAEKVIFPGVGEASSAMRKLKEKGLDTLIPTLKQPVLGICLGMQLMCKHSEEGDTEGLGIFEEKVKLFPPGLKIPHMGWNDFKSCESTLFKGIEENDDMYFVHSFYVDSGKDSIAQTEYGIPFCSAINKDNFWGVQFHPEKSGTAGERLLKNFIKL